jgi:hypothetical protein
MHEQLDDYRSRFRSLKREATRIVDGADDETLRTRPAPDTWSVAQVFDHVNTARPARRRSGTAS